MRNNLVVITNNYLGFDYIILNLDIYPVAYVKIPETHAGYKKTLESNFYNNIKVHGGITFAGIPRCVEQPDCWFIGWDYAHSGDCCAWDKDNSNLKKWTIDEVYKDVKKVIRQIKKVTL